MTGKTVLITGANRGLGRAVALALAAEKARVVLLCRNEAKGRAALDEVRAAGGEGDLIVADLRSLGGVRGAAATFKERYDRLDVLVNNAAVILAERQITVDNLEETFAVNYLSHFVLTVELMPCLLAGGASGTRARVVNVSSEAHRDGYMRWHDIRFKANYGAHRAYAMSKLAMMLFMRDLARRLAGKPVNVNALHPGPMSTGFGIPPSGWKKFTQPVAKLTWAAPEQAAAYVVRLANAPELEGVSGAYYVKDEESRVSGFAGDEGLSRRMWTISEHLAGIRLMEFAA